MAARSLDFNGAIAISSRSRYVRYGRELLSEAASVRMGHTFFFFSCIYICARDTGCKCAFLRRRGSGRDDNIMLGEVFFRCDVCEGILSFSENHWVKSVLN